MIADFHTTMISEISFEQWLE